MQFSLPTGRFFYQLSAFLIIVVNTCITISAQNLVPNPGFEIYTSCPMALGQPGPMEPVPWVGVGSADYFNICASPMYTGVPQNFQGYQYAHQGVAYAGEYFKTQDNLYREYVQVRLLQPLEAGKCYKVGFWISLANETCGVNQAGALLTTTPVNWPLGMTPQVNYAGTFFTDTANWVYVFDFVNAAGGEEYLTIGNFYGDPLTTFDPACDFDPKFSYYYIDDVLVEEVPPEIVSVDLGDDVTVCDSYTIDPGLSDVVFHWSDGSMGPTLTVTTSGTYSVTVAESCNESEASIEVTVFNPEPVEIGPEALIFCPGDEYAISLDPELGQYEWSDGSTGADYLITTAGTYEVTMDDGCDITSDTMIVSSLDPPLPFSLGVDTFLCPELEIVYQFDPTLGDFEWQDGSSSSTYVVDDDGTYALTISNQCGEETDDVEIISINYPFFWLGPDSVTLCGNEVLDIDLDPSLGVFMWQDGSNDASYHIDTSGVYSLTVTNECSSETDEIFVEQISPPNIEFGQLIQACQGDTVILDPGNNAGAFQWQDGSSFATYEVTTAGTYSLTITNDCGDDNDMVDVSFIPLITPPDLGPDISLCPGEEITFNVSSPGAQYLWNDLNVTDSLHVIAAGEYFVNIYNQCASYSDTVNVTLNNAPPVLNLPSDFALCQGQTTILQPGVSGVSYSWSDGTTSPELSVSTPGVYSLTITNACGVDQDTINIIDGGLPPTVFIGPDTSICNGQSVIINPAFSDVDSWLWQDGSALPFFMTNTPGTFYVEGLNSCGTASDTLMISLLPAIPSLTLGPDTTICPGAAITISIGIPNVNILWSDGSSGSNITISNQATVFAFISNSCGTSTDSVTVSLLNDVPPLDLGPDQTICPGEMFTLNPEIPDVDYLWQDGSTDPEFVATQGGSIILTISNECGSAVDTLVLVERINGPQVDLGPDIEVCQGEIVTIQAGISGVDYLWQDGSVEDEFVTSSSGTFILSVSNLCGMDSDTIEVAIGGLPPSPLLGPDTNLCEGNTLLLTAQPEPNTTWLWQNGSTASTFLVSMPGVYSLKATNDCGDGADSIVVSFTVAPDEFELGPDTTLCPGQSFVISAPFTNNEIVWQDGSILPTILANNSLKYSLRISNECGSVSDTLEVLFDTNVPQLDLEPFLEWCEGDIFTLDASQAFSANYLWSTGDITSQIVVTSPGLYEVEVAAPCIAAVSQSEVTPILDCGPDIDIYIPNVISPNGDGVNDVFALFVGPDLEVQAIEGTIFDRWGNMVFNSTIYPFVWDGKFHEDQMQPGVYVYVIKISYKVEENVFEEVFYGDITLIR